MSKTMSPPGARLRRGEGRRPSLTGRLVLVATAAFLALCLLAGGASRIGDLPLVLIRPLAVLLIGLLAALVPLRSFASYRAVLALLGLFALTMAVQLVPLPPAMWRQLPLSGLYVPALADLALVDLWRPVSIAPDLTVNSLLALLPPLAALLGTAAIGQSHRRELLTFLLVGMAFSAFLGLAQVAGGPNSPFYLWRDRSEAVADGLFANRNHQAAFLACGLALLGAWVTQIDRRRPHRGVSTLRLLAGGGLALLFLVTVVATGSRTGTALALVAVSYSYWIVVRSPASVRWREWPSKPARWLVGWGWLVAPLLLAGMALAGRAATIDRLFSTDALEDQRVRSFPVMTDMAQRAFPFGSGYGTFDPFFRTLEPRALLHYGYFNHAHNDFLELVIVGGLPAAIVVVLAGLWWAVTTVRLHRVGHPSSDQVLARSAGVGMALIAVASAVDYPARTPLIACLLAVLAVWMTDGLSRDATTSPPAAPPPR